MPNRILREGIIESVSVNELTPSAELFYRRLMSKVDDYGRFHGHPALILAACYPLQLDRITQENIRSWVAECEENHLILTYEVSGKKYVSINNFGQRERTDSKFPAPCAQNVREMLAECAQPADTARLARAAASRARSESESESESESHTGKLAGAKLNGHAEYPVILAEIRKHDAAADDAFARRLMMVVTQFALSNPKFPRDQLDKLTDENVAECVAESYRSGPRNHGTGLLLNRVPGIVLTWSLED